MLNEDQLKRIISANDSLRIQLADANAILAAREAEIRILHAELSDAAALRSRLEGQTEEIESMQYLLHKKERQFAGAEERELDMHRELTDYARLNKDYNELLQDYAYLQSQFKDIHSQLAALNARNFELEQIAARVGELQSKLENSFLERDELKSRIADLETQQYLREFNL